MPSPRKLSDTPLISEVARKDLLQYERGIELLSITAVPGWEVILDILREEVESDERKLLALRDSEPNQLFRLHSELQGKKKLLSRLEASVKFLTELATNPPESVQKYTPITS